MSVKLSELMNGGKLVRLSGKFDIVAVGQMEGIFLEYAREKGTILILDLSDVTFLASIGIRLIVTTVKALANNGGRLAILNPTPDVMEVLDVTGIPSIIPIYSTLDEAVAGLIVDAE